MNKIDISVRIILGIMLFLSGVKDMKIKKISIHILIPCFIFLLICFPYRSDITIMNSILGILVGVFMLGISKISKGQVGFGDGIILMMTGLGLGAQENVILLIYALLSISIFAGILLMIKRISRKSTLPFIPFLFIGYMGVIFIK